MLEMSSAFGNVFLIPKVLIHERKAVRHDFISTLRILLTRSFLIISFVDSFPCSFSLGHFTWNAKHSFRSCTLSIGRLASHRLHKLGFGTLKTKPISMKEIILNSIHPRRSGTYLPSASRYLIL